MIEIFLAITYLEKAYNQKILLGTWPIVIVAIVATVIIVSVLKDEGAKARKSGCIATIFTIIGVVVSIIALVVALLQYFE